MNLYPSFLVLPTLCLSAFLGSAQPATGQSIASWHFNTEQTQADSGFALCSAVNVVHSYVQGVGAGKSISLRSFAPQATGSAERGLLLEANTLGMDSVWIQGLLRGSSTSSRWWRIDASTDLGSTWTNVWAPDSGWGPFDVWVPFNAYLPGTQGHELVWIRLVSVFSPLPFSNFGGSYGANQAYQGMRANPTTSSQNYSTSGTWRWDDLKLRGRELAPKIWNGQQWSNGAPSPADNALVQGSYQGLGFVCANLRIAAGAVLDVAPGGSLDVRGRLVLDGELVLHADSGGQAQMRLSAAGLGTGTLRAETFWPHHGWNQLSSPLDRGVTGLSGANQSALYSWNSDSGEYRSAGQDLGSRGQGYFGMSSGTIGLEGPAPRQPWSQWSLGYADNPNPTSTVHSTAVTDGWNLLGNPLACNLEFASLARVGVDASYSIWDPSALGGIGSYSYYSPSGGSLSGFIAPLQGFWVRSHDEGSSLTLANRGTLGASSGGPNPIRLNLKALENSDLDLPLWILPDGSAQPDLDLERDAAARASPTPLRWVVETPSGDAAAKSWNPADVLLVRSEAASPMRVEVGCTGAASALWLTDGIESFRLDQGPLTLELQGVQHWRLMGSSMALAEATEGLWRTGPGILWSPEAQDLELLTMLGQVVLRRYGINGEPVAHHLPEGAYVLRWRSAGAWNTQKIILKP